MTSLKRPALIRTGIIAVLVAYSTLVAHTVMHARASDRPLELILPLSVGSTGDIVARKLVPGIARSLERPVYVENIPGAGGIIGTEELVSSRKDGSVLAVVDTSHLTKPGLYRHMPYDSIKDVTPIAVIGDSPQVLVINPTLPVHNLQEFVDYVHAHPGHVAFGSGGIGTTLHLLGVELEKEANIQMIHVPYRGNSPMLSALLANEVQAAFQSTTQATPYIKAHKLRAIGLSSAHRSRLLPDVPTLAEQGLHGFDLSIWMAVIGPSDMAAPEVTRLNQSINAALAQPDVQSWFYRQDWHLTPMTPDAARSFFENQKVKYAQLVKESGARQQ